MWWIIGLLVWAPTLAINYLNVFATGHPENIFTVPVCQFLFALPFLATVGLAHRQMRINPSIAFLFCIVMSCLPFVGPPVVLVSLYARLSTAFRALGYRGLFDGRIAKRLDQS
jgi:hypothetical protein